MIHVTWKLLLTAVLSLSPILHDRLPALQVASGTPAPAAARGSAAAVSHPLACPGPDFAAFLEAFGEDPEVQRRYTRFPLRYVTLEEGPDGPTTRERRLPADSLPWPLLLPARVRAQEGLEVTIDSTAAGQWSVTVAQPATDYGMGYLFVLGRGPDRCWQLVRYDNATL